MVEHVPAGRAAVCCMHLYQTPCLKPARVHCVRYYWLVIIDH